MFRKTVGLASAGMLAVGLGAAAMAPAAQAKPAAADSTTSTTAACALRLGSVTSTGAFTSRMINATAPITVGGVRGTAGVFPANQVQHISTFYAAPLGSGESRSGLAVMGGALYSSSFVVDSQSQLDPHYPHNNLRIGGGWSNYRWIEESILQPANAGNPARVLLYGQRTDGITQRWVSDGGSWRVTSGVGGLSTVKGIAVIGRTATTETFLANTRAGALVTLTWPTSYLSAPTSRVVRGSTWQGFEQLIATKCGTSGTLLLGIDRDTKSGYLYAVGHANGTATVIKSLGKVPLTFSDPKYFRIAPKYDVLNGG
ncbi:hypothetical protein [Kribbella shirazensis]|uniref:Uncharacterized protein n=1 Tax=Kribbella shirazensis TaxID=1105143 RepID=A0A7X5VEN9_9ACTN|nr:hypothetical protein [Kribbella shirazensis]NIK58958.1 hypothetical protein [Kribbella shirazensis]